MLFPSDELLPTYPHSAHPPDPGGPLVRPWGVLQAVPISSEPLPDCHPTVVRVELDPDTQTTLCYDQHGYLVVAAGKHRKTYEWREIAEDTEPDQDSADGKTHTDYVRRQVPVD